MSSDNVVLLSFNRPMLASEVVTTEKVILGQYISLSIIPKSDTDLELTLQFSGDGKNWDYSIQRSVASLSNTEISTNVRGKWFRIIISNLSLSPSTFTRMYVYGTPSNSSISANISKIGNLNPEVNVGNLPLSPYGEVSTSKLITYLEYSFTRGTGGNVNPKSYSMPYFDIKTSGTANPVILFNDNLLKIGNVQPNDFVLLQSSCATYKTGLGMTFRFSSQFVQSPKLVSNDGSTLQYVGAGNSDTSINTIYNFVGFGYGDKTIPSSDPNSFGIIYINNQVKTFIPRNLWNVDHADGNYILPDMDLNLMTVYQITIQHLGAGSIKFYIQNPNDGLFYLVHILSFLNTLNSQTNFSDPTLGLTAYIYMESPVIPISITDFIAIGGFLAATEEDRFSAVQRIGYSSAKTISAETNIVSISNLSTWYSRPNFDSLMLDWVSASCDGAKNVTFNVYLNATLVGAVFNQTQPLLSPIAYDTTGVYTAGTGILLYSMNVAKVFSSENILNSLFINLPPGFTITITAQSTSNNDIVLGVSTKGT